jgi:CHAP domain
MSAPKWWENANPGAKMVGPAMTRPLYPPDAASRGKTPSSQGSDVVAIKRAVWRSGHWPGPASAFDAAFSNAFAHGKSGNVSENGLAGLQRQNGIDATGWMGEATYNLIRSALIPAGLPHAGEHLLDQTAIDQLEHYAKQQAGGASTVRELALAKARTFLGYKESPSGTNGNIFGEWYGMNFEPWCAMFVAYCFEHVAGGSPTFVKGSRYSYCPYVVSDARAGRYGLKTTVSPIPGDLVVYDWQRDGTFDHIGIFESGGSSNWQAIEGNTSSGNNSNGGQVQRRYRSSSEASVVFARVAEP